MSKLFKERIPFKPFEYPIYHTEGWLKQAQAFWLHTEIPMSGDVKDWNEKLTNEEKHLVGNILLGFATLRLVGSRLQSPLSVLDFVSSFQTCS